MRDNNLFNYLIDSLSDDAFELCVVGIYDILDFKYITKHDV